jgi:hypothetical protein
MGLQEERVQRDAWKGIANALERLKEARQIERRAGAGKADMNMDDE